MTKTKSYSPIRYTKFFLFIALFLFSIQSFADVNDTIEKPRLSVYARPLALLSDYPSFQLGVDYKLPPGVRFGLVLGYGSFGNAKTDDAIVLDYSLYEFRPQVQFFIPNKNPKLNFGLGVEFVYADIVSHLGKGEYILSSSSTIEFDEANYSERRRLFHFIGSLVFKPKHHFVFETYLGIGFGSKYIEYNEVENATHYYGGSSWLSLPNFSKQESSIGEQGGLSATIGLKIGYRF
jgi:hypothetical protein